MQVPTVETERRRGIRWMVAGAIVLGVSLALWWLVATTNSEGDHDAELLPFVALVPLLIGVYHLARSRHIDRAAG
jgi:hypothetical protein